MPAFFCSEEIFRVSYTFQFGIVTMASTRRVIQLSREIEKHAVKEQYCHHSCINAISDGL